MKIIVGTRKSHLPLLQSREVAQLLTNAGAEVEIRPLATIGDTLEAAIEDRGSSGIFTGEIDEALKNREIDVAVHDVKDLGFELPDGVSIAAVPARVDPREAFVSARSRKLSSLAKGARVGITGRCRGVQLARIRPDLELLTLHGDVEAKLRALSAGEIDAVIMAAAGPIRMGIQKTITEYLPVDKFVPQAGQGALAIEVRSDDRELLAFVRKACHHNASGLTVRAERGFVRALSGMQGVVLAANAEIKPSGFLLVGLVASSDGSMFAVERESGPLDEAGTIGKKLAEKMMKKIEM
ncbi:MAG: hydroxymethylbilane synthase [bacterium]